MNNTQRLHALGQSLWLDNISRRILDDGTLRHYIDEFSVTGLTSNPTIFDEAIASDVYDDAIRDQGGGLAKSGEGCSPSWRSKTCDARPTVSPDLRCDRRCRRLGLDGAVAVAGR